MTQAYALRCDSRWARVRDGGVRNEERRAKSRSHLSSPATNCLVSGDCFPRSHVSWPQESQSQRGEEVKESVHQYTSLDGQHFSLCGINSPASSRCMHWGPERPRGIPGLSINLGASSKETRGPRYRSEPGHSRQYLDEAKGSPRRANHQRGWDRRG